MTVRVYDATSMNGQALSGDITLRNVSTIEHVQKQDDTENLVFLELECAEEDEELGATITYSVSIVCEHFVVRR